MLLESMRLLLVPNPSGESLENLQKMERVVISDGYSMVKDLVKDGGGDEWCGIESLLFQCSVLWPLVADAASCRSPSEAV